MDTPGRSSATRDQLLMSVTKRDTSRGSYSPSTTEREIAFGSKSSSELNEMISFHESHHAFLNASTTFGIAMVYCGSLVETSETPFLNLVREMIDHSITTHETFATVRGLLTATNGDISSWLLQDFPSYQVHFDRFLEFFEPHQGIGLATMALSNAARIAMQTPIYPWLLETPCERWLELPFEDWNNPDARFEVLLNKDVIRAAKKAMLDVLADSTSILSELTQEHTSASDQWNAISKAKPDDFVPAETAAFDVFATALEQTGFARSGYDDQRAQLSLLTAKVEAALGPDSNQRFESPKEGEDYQTVIADFRREVLSLRDKGLPLFVTDLEEQERHVIEAFVHKGSKGKHLQFVSMPLMKAKRVFQLAENCGALKRLNSEHLSGFRRLARTPEGGFRVEFLAVEEHEAAELVLSLTDVLIYKSLSLVTSRDETWSAKWLGAGKFFEASQKIIIDDDPVALMNRLADQNELISVVGYRMNMPVQNQGNIVLDLIAFRAAAEPERLYFTPCTSSLRTAVLKLAMDSGAPFNIEKSLPEEDQKFLADTLFNLLQEEGRFGAAFWAHP